MNLMKEEYQVMKQALSDIKRDGFQLHLDKVMEDKETDTGPAFTLDESIVQVLAVEQIELARLMEEYEQQIQTLLQMFKDFKQSVIEGKEASKAKETEMNQEIGRLNSLAQLQREKMDQQHGIIQRLQAKAPGQLPSQEVQKFNQKIEELAKEKELLQKKLQD